MPIIKTSFLASRGQVFGTVTPGTSGAGGTLAAGTYFYRVSAIINRFGEVQASGEVSQVTTGATSTASLAFAAPVGPDGNSAILYKVWRGTAAGNETLLGCVAAVDDLGVPVTSIVDTGTNLLANGRAATGVAPWPTSYAGGNLGQHPRNVKDEEIYLIPKNADFLVRPYVRDFFAKDLAQTVSAPDVLPFYIASDTTLAVRGPKYVGRLSRIQGL